MVEVVEELLAEAAHKKWGYSEFLSLLLQREVDRREQKIEVNRLRKSQLDPDKRIETFDVSFNARIYEPLFKELALCQFVKNKENILLVSPSGVGKSHLAQTLGCAACSQGHDALFYRTQALFERR